MTDPDFDTKAGVSGADVVKESLRQKCIWNIYGGEAADLKDQVRIDRYAGGFPGCPGRPGLRGELSRGLARAGDGSHRLRFFTGRRSYRRLSIVLNVGSLDSRRTFGCCDCF